MSGLPDNCIVEFFGKIDKEQFFIIISLESGEKKAYLGPAQDMKEIKVDSFTVHGRGKPVVVETEMGKFFFPAVCDWHKE
ncbi:MAG: hypothetical protein COT61_04890, partial [Candidatus Portnoybacteria bacterium CG09_land_8_20_14_0_10_44_13]